MHDGERREDDGDVVHTSSGPSVALIAFVVLGVAGIVFILQTTPTNLGGAAVIRRTVWTPLRTTIFCMAWTFEAS
ncbi:MAG: hypothetical protein ABW122_03225, partial [Ilumatobacteraceae bacterium]